MKDGISFWNKAVFFEETILFLSFRNKILSKQNLLFRSWIWFKVLGRVTKWRLILAALRSLSVVGRVLVVVKIYIANRFTSLFTCRHISSAHHHEIKPHLSHLFFTSTMSLILNTTIPSNTTPVYVQLPISYIKYKTLRKSLLSNLNHH